MHCLNIVLSQKSSKFVYFFSEILNDYGVFQAEDGSAQIVLPESNFCRKLAFGVCRVRRGLALVSGAHGVELGKEELAHRYLLVTY